MYLTEDSRLERPLVDTQLCALLEQYIVGGLLEHCKSKAKSLVMGDSEREFMQLGPLIAYGGKFQSIVDESKST